MKKVLVLVLVLVFSYALKAQTIIPLAVDSSYASADTTAWVSVNPMKSYSAYFWFKDSANVSIDLQYAFPASGTGLFLTCAIVSDSTAYTDTLGSVKSLILRNAATDSIPSAVHVRLIVTPKTTGNPSRNTANPKFDAYMIEPQ